MTDTPAERFERTHTATLRTLVQYAGASGDFYEMHYDVPFAQARGHAELSVHGLLKTAWLDAARIIEEELVRVFYASRSILKRSSDGGI